MVRTCNPSQSEAEAGELQVNVHPGNLVRSDFKMKFKQTEDIVQYSLCQTPCNGKIKN